MKLLSDYPFLATSILAVLVFGGSAILWERPFVLSVVLVALSIPTIFLERKRADLFLFLAAALAGPLTEALLIWAGAWEYASPHILGFPVWLPLVWGNASLFIKRLYFVLNKF